jgi:hypothetical protein
LTLVEDGQEASPESGQEPAPGGVKVRRSRRPNLRLEEEREIAQLYTDAIVPTSEIRARYGIGESSLYRIIQRQGVPLRGRSSGAAATTRRASTAKTDRKRASSDGSQGTGPVAVAAAVQASAAAPVRRGRPARRASIAQPSTSKFRIRYRGERVFEAYNIQDALGQAESLGATEILAVARES